MFCASFEGWTKQGNGYFGGHVRYSEWDDGSDEGETRGRTNLTSAALIGQTRRTGERGFGEGDEMEV